jgi:hypothetical protein
MDVIIIQSTFKVMLVPHPPPFESQITLLGNLDHGHRAKPGPSFQAFYQ